MFFKGFVETKPDEEWQPLKSVQIREARMMNTPSLFI